MTIEMVQALSTEAFWEYISGNLSADDVVQELAAMYVTTTVEQIREARMRDAPCGAWSGAHNRAFLMAQPC